MFRMLIHPSSGACDLFVELFHGLYCSGTMCVGVTVWFGWGGVVSRCRLHKDTTPIQASHNVTPTHIEPGMSNLIYKTSEYVQETLSKTYHTQRKLNNRKTPQRPTFAETRFLKQPHTSRLNTHHWISTIMLKPLSLQSNTTHEITQQISHKLLRMDVVRSETCWAVNNEIMKQVTSSWSLSLFNYQDDARSNKHKMI